MDICPDDAALRFELATHHKSLGQYPQALIAFREASARRAGFVEAHLGAASCANEVEQFRDAVREFEAAIAAAPDRAAAYRGLGVTLNQSKSPQCGRNGPPRGDTPLRQRRRSLSLACG